MPEAWGMIDFGEKISSNCEPIKLDKCVLPKYDDRTGMRQTSQEYWKDKRGHKLFYKYKTW